MSYDPNIPAANDDPSVSQGQMQTNFNLINNGFTRNHTPLGLTNAGTHTMSTYIARSEGSSAPATATQQGNLYTKRKTNGSTRTELVYTNDTTTDEYQLTRCNSTRFDWFGQLLEDPIASGSGIFYGWTFMAGNIIYNYGVINLATAVSGSNTVTYVIPLTTLYTGNVIGANGNSFGTGISGTTRMTTNMTNTGFQFNRGIGATGLVYWFAMGV